MTNLISPFRDLCEGALKMYALVHTKRCAWQKYNSYLDKNVRIKCIIIPSGESISLCAVE